MYNSQIVVERIKARTRETGHNMSDLNAYCQIDKSTVNMSAQKKYGLSAKISKLRLSLEDIKRTPPARSKTGGVLFRKEI